jgi:hypothetical protein
MAPMRDVPYIAGKVVSVSPWQLCANYQIVS